MQASRGISHKPSSTVYATLCTTQHQQHSSHPRWTQYTKQTTAASHAQHAHNNAPGELASPLMPEQKLTAVVAVTVWLLQQLAPDPPQQ
jgi:hypothetical protein